MRDQQHELTESLVDNYNLDTAQKAIMVEDLDLLLEKNREQVYSNPTLGEDGLLKHEELEDDDEEGEEMKRLLQIGNNYHEHVRTEAGRSTFERILPALVAGTLIFLGLLGAALLWPGNGDEAKADPIPTESVDTDTNTDTVVRIVE